MIEYGDADVMVCGGAESTVTPLAVGGFASAKALSTRNDDPATTQTGQVVRHVRPGQPEFLGELGRISRLVEECQQNPGSGRVGHGAPDPRHGIDP